MAGSPQQQELDFGDAARLEAHLVRCGFSAVQAGLAGMVFARGTTMRVGDGERMVLTISSRQAAALLGCNDRSVRDAAATLNREEWFQVVEVGRRRPPLYVLDVAAAASVPTTQQRLDERFEERCDEPLANGVPPPHLVGCGEVRATAGHCGPLRGPARALTESNLQNPCSYSSTSYTSSTHTTGTPHHSAPPRTSPHHPAAGRELPRLPWLKEGGVSDAELVRAVAAADLVLLRHLFDHALAMGWIEFDGDRVWADFLTACHHAATARLSRRMGRLVAFTKQGLDVARCGQRSDQWAGAMLAREHRDPALVALGRMMGDEEG